jgi:hypothetical protein
MPKLFSARGAKSQNGDFVVAGGGSGRNRSLLLLLLLLLLLPLVLLPRR